MVAGKGGFNISHQIEHPALAEKYTPPHFLEEALQSFSPNNLRQWYADLGISTYVGSSSRIFPEKGISPADVLRAIKKRLKNQGVNVILNHEFIGFSPNKKPIVQHKDTSHEVHADIYIFALGGASWKVTGSSGNWLEHFEKIGIPTVPFTASNCGLNIKWPTAISDFHTGKPLKNIQVSVNNAPIKGEALITTYGIEGNAIYPVSSAIGKELLKKVPAHIYIDFKPQFSRLTIVEKCKNLPASQVFKILKLSPPQIALIKAFTTKEEFLNVEILISKIKHLPIPIQSLRPIDEAISTAGGIDTNALSPHFSLKKYPHIYCLGEMVNWDAPTGGFLLHGCFSMANFMSRSVNQ